MASKYEADGKIHVMEPREGRAYNEICAAACELNAGLIVIATHGNTGLKHVFLGSTAERVVQHSPCPLLVVRQQAGDYDERSARLRRILVPIDFSSCSKKALQYAICFAKQHQGTLTLLYVAQVLYPVPEVGAVDVSLVETRMRENGEQELAELIKKEIAEQVPAKGIVRVGNAYFEIVSAAKSLEIDLIIISTHGRTGLKHVFMGSTAESVVRYASCPVLVVREHEHDFVTPQGD